MGFENLVLFEMSCGLQESLDLNPGASSVTFTVSSSLQGEKSVCGTIYLWPTDIKIVVSDVDGTITRWVYLTLSDACCTVCAGVSLQLWQGR